MKPEREWTPEPRSDAWVLEQARSSPTLKGRSRAPNLVRSLCGVWLWLEPELFCPGDHPLSPSDTQPLREPSTGRLGGSPGASAQQRGRAVSGSPGNTREAGGRRAGGCAASCTRGQGLEEDRRRARREPGIAAPSPSGFRLRHRERRFLYIYLKKKGDSSPYYGPWISKGRERTPFPVLSAGRKIVEPSLI